MSPDHDSLLKLVVQVNGAIAVISWPFALYEALNKKASAVDLKSKLSLRRAQLLGEIASRIGEVILPFWPRSTGRIIFDPSYNVEAPTSLSDDARDAVTTCLGECEILFLRAWRVKTLSRRVFAMDRLLYWLIYCTAGASLLGLSAWFFMKNMSDTAAKTAIVAPVSVILLALVCAGIRQAFIQNAEHEIISEEGS